MDARTAAELARLDGRASRLDGRVGHLERNVEIASGDPPARTASFTTPSLADGATWQGTVTLARGYQLLHIETSHAARVRLYLSAAYQSGDASRVVGVPPGPDAGLTFEEDGSDGAQDYALAWPALGASLEDSTAIPVSVTNRSGATRSIDVELTWR